jgi:DNA-binding GntR family transcriptional regulator
MSQPGRLADSVREINAIVEAVRRRDAEAACEAAEGHVASAARITDQRFEEMERQAGATDRA